MTISAQYTFVVIDLYLFCVPITDRNSDSFEILNWLQKFTNDLDLEMQQGTANFCL